MSDPVGTIALSAAFLAGIAGSAHCLVMCGGISGALSMRSRAFMHSPRGAWRESSLYHAGRLGGYATAGALFGLFGASLQSLVDLPLLATIARLAAGSLLVLVAVRVLSGLNVLSWIERLGARFWKLLQPLAKQAVGSRSPARSLVLGLLWGWLPCGLVYSMLLFAALSGNAVRGAGVMLAFGAGTLPAMLIASVAAAHLSRAVAVRGGRQLSGAILLVFGLWLAWAALPFENHSHHASGQVAVELRD
jgi:uncharacterized protein